MLMGISLPDRVNIVWACLIGVRRAQTVELLDAGGVHAAEFLLQVVDLVA
jgi:hypothetical protein